MAYVLHVIAWSDIQHYCDSIAREFQPRRIVLFGSHASGRERPDSDVDVLVVMPVRKRGSRPSLEIRRRIPAKFPVDILVRTPEDVECRLRQGDSFITEVMTRGKIMYEAEHTRMGRQG